METYRNYRVQRIIVPVWSPFRIWKYEIENTATGRKFVYEVRIEDCLQYNSMPLEDMQRTVERQIEWYLKQKMEGDRIVKFVGDKTCK